MIQNHFNAIQYNAVIVSSRNVFTFSLNSKKLVYIDNGLIKYDSESL